VEIGQIRTRAQLQSCPETPKKDSASAAGFCLIRMKL
jgi:hypothetical protein